MKCTLQFDLLTTYHSKIPCKMSYTPKCLDELKGTKDDAFWKLNV